VNLLSGAIVSTAKIVNTRKVSGRNVDDKQAHKPFKVLGYITIRSLKTCAHMRLVQPEKQTATTTAGA
jgi:hypothetical protein